ncbi:hypothetical protein EYF80_023499 [Liparis tanakae]|uniref:Uncharacterized protein n=1 Tax=Liparis tanakae TaxID=230148 RepID=A0A4Z2HLV3_9TELE|nr:hypothetical protein EYF80_023499 [Liparis tanakae]
MALLDEEETAFIYGFQLNSCDATVDTSASNSSARLDPSICCASFLGARCLMTTQLSFFGGNCVLAVQTIEPTDRDTLAERSRSQPYSPEVTSSSKPVLNDNAFIEARSNAQVDPSPEPPAPTTVPAAGRRPVTMVM